MSFSYKKWILNDEYKNIRIRKKKSASISLFRLLDFFTCVGQQKFHPDVACLSSRHFALSPVSQSRKKWVSPAGYYYSVESDSLYCLYVQTILPIGKETTIDSVRFTKRKRMRRSTEGIAMGVGGFMLDCGGEEREADINWDVLTSHTPTSKRGREKEKDGDRLYLSC